jgi:hypothetical protein
MGCGRRRRKNHRDTGSRVNGKNIIDSGPKELEQIDTALAKIGQEKY